MSVCMYVCMFVCLYACTSVKMYACIYVGIQICVHASTLKLCKKGKQRRKDTSKNTTHAVFRTEPLI